MVDPGAVFSWGVASGDPAPDGVILWTRVPASPTGPVGVRWRVAADPALRDVVVTGVASAAAAADWTVKVRIRDPALRPYTTYWYAFDALGATSRTGRFRTLPDPAASVEHLRLGYVSCQDFTSGRFHALRLLADTDVDYVLHLGDYIYESVSDPQFQRRGPSDRRLHLPGGGSRAETLGDYRWLYRTYRRDPDLYKKGLGPNPP